MNSFSLGVRGLLTIGLLAFSASATAQYTDSPCGNSLQYLQQQYAADPRTRSAFDAVYAGLVDMPSGYTYNGSSVNPWRGAGSGEGLFGQMVDMFTTWCTALPEISGDEDNALDPILYFAWFYYRNPAGQDFVQGRDPLSPSQPLESGSNFLAEWNKEYLAFMNSTDSARRVAEWGE